MNVKSIESVLAGKPYPGRGLLVGLTPDRTQLVTAYFIMGRSENSRNRVFAKKGNDLYTEPFDVSRVEDPSLIIYRALTGYQQYLIATNGDQTDTIRQGLEQGQNWQEALDSRRYEPDAPNFTPRISVLWDQQQASYQLSILKKPLADDEGCARFYYSYPAVPGYGHLIHTYQGALEPLISYTGEPKLVSIGNDLDELTHQLWEALDPDNRISIYIRFTDAQTGEYTDRIINKNQTEK